MKKYKINKKITASIIFLVLIFIITIIVYYFYDIYYKKKTESLNDYNTLQVMIEDLQDRVNKLENENSNLINKIDTQNQELQSKVWECTTYIKMYQLFYEKADEMFANGISGCAIDYINSGDATKLPEGCYRWWARKVPSNSNYNDWYMQDPDHVYYDSLRELYYQMIDFKAKCES